MSEASGFRGRLSTAPTSIGLWSQFPDPQLLNALAAGGFDWVCVDEQHGYASAADFSPLIGAANAAGVDALVRVAWNREEIIGRALDSGAAGVIVPMVESPADAERAVASSRYAPLGRRSWGPRRGVWGAGPHTASEDNDSTACLVMVETPGAVERVEEIASVPGVDGIFVGPFDLSLAYGRPVDELLSDASADSPLRRVVAACASRGVVAGAFGGSIERARLLFDVGFTMLAVATDEELIRAAARAAVAEASVSFR
jgi:4-hydroxy-2-oxoheptanedioate aldolase